MAYGYRLNIEDVFFKLAEENFEIASKLSGLIPDNSGEENRSIPFRGYPTEDGLSSASIAVVGWAISLEAFTNLAWNQTVAHSIPEGKIRNTIIRQFSTPEKIQEIFNSFNLDCKTFSWWHEIRKLFELRNELVHYKHEIAYQGFSFAPIISKKLSEEAVKNARQSTISTIREMGQLCSLRISFLDGDYEIATVNP